MCQAYDGERKFLEAMASMERRNEAGEGEEWREFYNQHRGGAGAIIMVTAVPPTGDLHKAEIAMFSCIERAEDWAATFSDKHQVIFAPYVVDEPDFGIATRN